MKHYKRNCVRVLKLLLMAPELRSEAVRPDVLRGLKAVQAISPLLKQMRKMVKPNHGHELNS
jgi:hypothetical protein